MVANLPNTTSRPKTLVPVTTVSVILLPGSKKNLIATNKYSEVAETKVRPTPELPIKAEGFCLLAQ